MKKDLSSTHPFVLEEGWEVMSGRIPCELGQVRKEAAIASIIRVICGLPPYLHN